MVRPLPEYASHEVAQDVARFVPIIMGPRYAWRHSGYCRQVEEAHRVGKQGK